MTTIEQIKTALQTHIAEADVATPGPWDVNSKYVGRMADATFIAHARTMSPAACKCLLEAIEGLQSIAKQESKEGCTAEYYLESIRQEWHNLTQKQ